jgi:histidinol dehydrogenase
MSESSQLIEGQCPERPVPGRPTYGPIERPRPEFVEGLEAGRRHIARLRRRDGMATPLAVADRLREIFGRELSPAEAVAQIVADVRSQGDAALREYTRLIEGVSADQLALGAETIEAAYSATPAPLREALHLAGNRIRAFHEREPRGSWLEWDEEGGALGQMVRPLRRVGVYVPGGSAAYPSSLLMSVIPAQVAGVEQIVVTTPRGPDGRPAQVTLAAAWVAGLDRLFLLGGAQAVAALAYGTESVPRVDKIVGAGGLFVTLAKRAVYGDVGIDGLYGPTETLLIADETAEPAVVAADLLAQAEHDPLATALLVTTSPSLAEAVREEIARQAVTLERSDIIGQSLRGQGAIIVVADLTEALALANEYGPEHLCLLVEDPWPLLGLVRNAGGVFVGHRVSEALGDYVVGPSHVMPTGGTARFASPLHVRDFLKVTSVFAPGDATTRRLGPAAQAIASAEGLTGHAAAIAARDSSE